MKTVWLPIGLGVLMIVCGIIALLNPFATTLAVEQFLAWVFLIGGVFQLIAVFSAESWGQRIWGLILAAVNLWLGVSLLGNPLAGVITLTIVVGIMFAVSGVIKVIYAFNLRGTPFFWAVLISGAVSVVLAAMVFSNFPQSAAVLLGILLAVELLSSGVTLVAMGIALKSVTNRAPAHA